MYEALRYSREVGEVVLGGVAYECHNDGLERVRVRLFKVEQHLHASAYVSRRLEGVRVRLFQVQQSLAPLVA